MAKCDECIKREFEVCECCGKTIHKPYYDHFPHFPNLKPPYNIGDGDLNNIKLCGHKQDCICVTT